MCSLESGYSLGTQILAMRPLERHLFVCTTGSNMTIVLHRHLMIFGAG